MLDHLTLKNNKLSIFVLLVSNKLTNFIFMSVVLLTADESLGLGPLIIQGTAISGVLVATVTPIFYTLISRGYDSDAKEFINFTLTIFYVVFSIFVCLGIFFDSPFVLLLILGLSLSARGLCDAIISVEGLVVHRGVVSLLLVEPLRWTILLFNEPTDAFILILLVSLPLLTDWIVRFSSLRKLSRTWLLKFSVVVGSLGRDRQIRVGYTAIFACQLEQVFVFWWAYGLSSQESLVYLFALQVVGLLMNFYLPGWMELLRNTVKMNAIEKIKLIHKHVNSLYKNHFFFLSLIATALFLISKFEPFNAFFVYILSDYIGEFKDIDSILIIALVFVITCFRSMFMDINLLATTEFFFKKMLLGQAVFFIGVVVALSEIFVFNPFLFLIGIYVCAYAFSAFYHIDQVFDQQRKS